VGNHHYGYIG